MPGWKIGLADSVLKDLAVFPSKVRRSILDEAIERLGADPVTETRNLKVMRPNPVATHELRLSGRYRVLFTVDQKRRSIRIEVVGEKQGNRLFVQGIEYARHHENHSLK